MLETIQPYPPALDMREENNNMTIEEIYKDKFEVINQAYDLVAQAIEKDKKYSLATDELYELTFELWKMYLNDNQ